MHNWISISVRKPTHEGPFIACSMLPDRDDFHQKSEHYVNGRKVEGGEVFNLLHMYDVEENKWISMLGLYNHSITHWLEYIEPPPKTDLNYYGEIYGTKI